MRAFLKRNSGQSRFHWIYNGPSLNSKYVIKKGRLHGHRNGKLPENKEYYLVHNLKKRSIKRDYKGIHDRFLRDHVFRGRLIENSRDEEVCRAWDVLTEQDHTFPPWSWRRPTRAHSLLEVQTMEIGIEFFLYLVAMARILVVFLRIQRKSRKKRQAKACDRTEEPVVYRTLAKTSDEWLSRIYFILLQIDRLQLTAVYCNRRRV